jgi:hypothetical protein
MAESSQSRALSREGSSSETRRPKPANSCPQELGYKPALPGPARRGFGSLFLCQSSVVKIIAMVLKKERETFCACGLWARRWPLPDSFVALTELQAHGAYRLYRWMGCTREHVSCSSFRVRRIKKSINTQIVRFGNWKRRGGRCMHRRFASTLNTLVLVRSRRGFDKLCSTKPKQLPVESSPGEHSAVSHLVYVVGVPHDASSTSHPLAWG